MKKTALREYAQLIVKMGVNVQKGQEVMVYADLDHNGWLFIFKKAFGQLINQRPQIINRIFTN